MKHWSLGAECPIEDRRLTTILERGRVLADVGRSREAAARADSGRPRQSAERIRLSQETISKECAGEAGRYISNKETALNCQ